MLYVFSKVWNKRLNNSQDLLSYGQASAEKKMWGWLIYTRPTQNVIATILIYTTKTSHIISNQIGCIKLKK